jgi:hypothetical protein
VPVLSEDVEHLRRKPALLYMKIMPNGRCLLLIGLITVTLGITALEWLASPRTATKVASSRDATDVNSGPPYRGGFDPFWVHVNFTSARVLTNTKTLVRH